MTRYVSVSMILLFSFAFLFSFNNSAATAKPQDIEITLISPPVICKAVSFPVVAKVINNRSDGDILLTKAAWRWDQLEYEKELKEEIKPGGSARQALNRLKAKKGSLNANEENEVKVQYEKLKKATSYVRFTVTKEMAEEIQAKGSVKLALNLTGERRGCAGSGSFLAVCRPVWCATAAL